MKLSSRKTGRQLEAEIADALRTRRGHARKRKAKSPLEIRATRRGRRPLDEGRLIAQKNCINSLTWVTKYPYKEHHSLRLLPALGRSSSLRKIKMLRPGNAWNALCSVADLARWGSNPDGCRRN